MRRKIHPADRAAARVLAAAESYAVTLFLGQGRYARDRAGTLVHARLTAQRLETAFPNGKRALIYGIDAEGREALVTPATLAAMEAL